MNFCRVVSRASWLVTSSRVSRTPLTEPRGAKGMALTLRVRAARARRHSHEFPRKAFRMASGPSVSWNTSAAAIPLARGAPRPRWRWAAGLNCSSWPSRPKSRTPSSRRAMMPGSRRSSRAALSRRSTFSCSRADQARGRSSKDRGRLPPSSCSRGSVMGMICHLAMSTSTRASAASSPNVHRMEAPLWTLSPRPKPRNSMEARQTRARPRKTGSPDPSPRWDSCRSMCLDHTPPSPRRPALRVEFTDRLQPWTLYS